MNRHEIQKRFLKKLLQDDLERLIKYLEKYLIPESSLRDNFVIINAKYKEYKNNKLLNLLTDESSNRISSEIRVAFLEIVNLIKEEDMLIFSEESETIRNSKSVSEQNLEFQNWVANYEKIKGWLIDNFKEFNWYYSENEPEVTEEGQDLEYSMYKNTNCAIKIFGSYLIVKYNHASETRFLNLDPSDNFKSFSETKHLIKLNVLDLIESISHEIKIVENSSLFQIEFMTKDNLKKIRVEEYIEVDRIQHNNGEIERFEEESTTYEEYKRSLRLRSDNELFLKAFRRKMIQFRAICEIII